MTENNACNEPERAKWTMIGNSSVNWTAVVIPFYRTFILYRRAPFPPSLSFSPHDERNKFRELSARVSKRSSVKNSFD